jgi:predicted RNase H-like HicB family nuclease
MKIYYGLLHKDTDSAYGITFPDLPGCFAACDQQDDILEAAQTALVLYTDGEASLAQPRSVQELQNDRKIKAELAQGAILIAVPVITVERKARYNVMLDVDLVAGLDRQVRVAGTSRSDFVAAAIKDRLRAQAGAAIHTGTTHRALPSSRFRTASKDEKSVAASALARTKTKDVTSKAVASKAGKILHDPKVSKEAKSAAASALTQAAPKKAAAKKK